MTPERLQQIKERYDDEMIRRDHVAELIAHVDQLTAELARLRAEVRSLQLGSQRNADAHMVTHRENMRLREGIAHAGYNAEVNPSDDTGALNTLLGDLRALLNPPTEGETDA